MLWVLASLFKKSGLSLLITSYVVFLVRRWRDPFRHVFLCAVAGTFTSGGLVYRNWNSLNRVVCGDSSGQATLCFPETQKFIIVSTESHHWTLSWASYRTKRLSGSTPYSRDPSSYLGVQTGYLDRFFHGYCRSILKKIIIVTYLILIHDRFFQRLSSLFLLFIIYFIFMC